MIVNTNLYTQLEAGSTGGNIAIPGGTGTLTEQHLLALIEQKAKEILGSAVDAQRSFGFQAGENYYQYPTGGRTTTTATSRKAVNGQKP